MLAENHWRKGFGREIVTLLIRFCKQHFPSKEIIGKVHPENSASIRITQKLGFRDVGLIKSNEFDNGFKKLMLE